MSTTTIAESEEVFEATDRAFINAMIKATDRIMTGEDRSRTIGTLAITWRADIVEEGGKLCM